MGGRAATKPVAGAGAHMKTRDGTSMSKGELWFFGVGGCFIYLFYAALAAVLFGVIARVTGLWLELAAVALWVLSGPIQDFRRDLRHRRQPKPRVRQGTKKLAIQRERTRLPRGVALILELKGPNAEVEIEELEHYYISRVRKYGSGMAKRLVWWHAIRGLVAGPLAYLLNKLLPLKIEVQLGKQDEPKK